MLETKPFLLAKNVNDWMAEKNKRRLIRTVGNPDGIIRAFLSDRYRPLDNYDLLGAIMPVLQQYDFEVKSCELTETHFYLKAIVPTLTTDISVGDTVAHSKTLNVNFHARGLFEINFRVAIVNLPG